MSFENNLTRSLSQLEALPKEQRDNMRDKALGSFVPFVGTAGLHFEKMSSQEVIVTINNTREVQNHIQQVHAAASVLLAETASGMIIGMNVPDDKLPLMKSLSAKYIARSEGSQKAVAILTSDQINLIRETPKGDINVATKVTDSTGKEVVIVEMNWAWIPKMKKPQNA